MRNTIKVVAIGAGLSLATAISTAISQPATKDDVKALRDEIIENFRKQNEYMSKQDQRITRVERAIEDIRGEDRSRVPPPLPPRRIVHVHRYYKYYWCPPPPPWWW
jgi:hypothetical protein